MLEPGIATQHVTYIELPTFVFHKYVAMQCFGHNRIRQQQNTTWRCMLIRAATNSMGHAFMNIIITFSTTREYDQGPS